MKHWLALNGDFSEKNGKIVFHGGLMDPSNEVIASSNSLGKFGLLLFEDVMSNGEITATIEFESLAVNDEAEILFNFQNDANFMCAGIANCPAKYEYKTFNGQWNFVKLAGFNSQLSHRRYVLKVRLIGSTVELYINNIKAFSTLSTVPIQKTNIGLWVRSKSSITISNYKAIYQKATAFVVSQFGDNYDTLYSDVIKPICESSGFNATRGDEMATNSMILDDIILSIENAAVVIADISPDNPNVFYEVGYAHAIRKPTILLCEKNCRAKLPFDISGFRTIFNDNSIGGKRNVETRLQEHLHALNLAGDLIR